MGQHSLPHGGLQLTHFVVDAQPVEGQGAIMPEAVAIEDAVGQLRVVAERGPALACVKQFGGVKAASAHITMVKDALPLIGDPESVRSVIDYLQPMLGGNGGNGGNGLHVARIPEHMRGQYDRGARGGGRLHLRLIYGELFGMDVHEHRRAAFPSDGGRGGHIAEWRGNDLTTVAQQFQSNR